VLVAKCTLPWTCSHRHHIEIAFNTGNVRTIMGIHAKIFFSTISPF
jgi:hypothetical protein